MNYKQLFKNILYACGAQGVSFVLSILMSLFIPKILGVDAFGYWQLFIFYTSYAGLFHFGLNDGVYLKYGNKDYEALNYRMLGANMYLSVFVQSVIAAMVLLIAIPVLGPNEDRFFVIVETIIYIVICNYSSFLTTLLQISNRIKAYSTCVVIDKISFMAVVVIGIATKCSNFKLYIILYIATKTLAALYAAVCCKEVVGSFHAKGEIQEFVDNIKTGINLTISNVASMLVLGIGRAMIDQQWGIEAFGKFSFALSLANFFLQFISQVSLVLFPMLCRVDSKKGAFYYQKLRVVVDICLSGIFLGYMPVCYILGYWLPQYKDSLRYLIILLPICTYDGKMNMLCSTYLKVLRKEKILLAINVASLAVSGILCGISCYYIKNIYAVIVSMVVTIAIRSVFSEFYLGKLMQCDSMFDIIAEAVLAMSFVLCTWFLGIVQGWIICLVLFAIYLLVILKRQRKN